MSAGRRPLSFAMVALLALSVTGVTGCTTRSLTGAEEGAVRLEDVQLRFGSGERGEVELQLAATNPALPAGAYTEVSWELWLGNRWFAAGTQALAEPAPKDRAHPITVRAPLVFRRLQPPREDPPPIDVGVRGAVTLRSPAGTLRLPFEGSRRMRVENLPQVGAGADADE